MESGHRHGYDATSPEQKDHESSKGYKLGPCLRAAKTVSQMGNELEEVKTNKFSTERYEIVLSLLLPKSILKKHIKEFNDLVKMNVYPMAASAAPIHLPLKLVAR